MKKLLYSLSLCTLLVPAYVSAADVSNEVQMPTDQMGLDNINDSMDNFDDAEKVETENFLRNLASQKMDHKIVSESMPNLTVNDLQGDIKMHNDITVKQYAVRNTLEGLVRKLGGKLDYGPQQYLTQSNNEDNLSEADRNLIKNVKKVADLCRQAGDAHSKAGSVYESLRDLIKAGFEPGEKLESMAAELSKKATEASVEADKEMEALLGLKPIIEN